MKIAGLVLAGLVGLNSLAVLAHGFHVDAKEVAAALAAPEDLSDAYREEIRRLRAESERLHRIGKHHEAEAVNEQAAKLLIKK